MLFDWGKRFGGIFSETGSMSHSLQQPAVSPSVVGEDPLSVKNTGSCNGLPVIWSPDQDFKGNDVLIPDSVNSKRQAVIQGKGKKGKGTWTTTSGKMGGRGGRGGNPARGRQQVAFYCF